MTERLKGMPSEKQMDAAINRMADKIDEGNTIGGNFLDPHEHLKTGKVLASYGEPRDDDIRPKEVAKDPEAVQVYRDESPYYETSALVVKNRPNGNRIEMEANYVRGNDRSRTGRTEFWKKKRMDDGSTKELSRISEHPAVARAAIKFAAAKLEQPASADRKAA